MGDTPYELFMNTIRYWYHMFGGLVFNVNSQSVLFRKFTTSSFITCEITDRRKMRFCNELVQDGLLIKRDVNIYRTAYSLSDKGVAEAKYIVELMEL